VILRIGYIILFGAFLSSCSNQGAEIATDEIGITNDGPQLAESQPGDVSAVCGVVFEVSDFDDWLLAYNRSADATLILLRNINNPSIVMVFEGGSTHEKVRGRAANLSHENFLQESAVVGAPVVSLYNLQYRRPSETEMSHYVGLSFKMENFEEFLESLKEDIGLYHSYGLIPVGIGTDFEDPEEVYMLLSLQDFVTFRKRTNSPRKIHGFTNSLKLPESTMMSTWTKSKL
jgi:hypothetical protein